MRYIRNWLRGLLAASSLFAGVAAAQSTHSAFLDLDNDIATGCNTVTAAGPVNGAEVRITATVTGTPPMVTGVTRAQCVAGVFGADQSIAGTYAVGLNNGLLGSDVIEIGTSLSGLGSGGAALVTVVSTSSGSSDIASGVVQLPGGGANLDTPVLVPATGIIALLAIAGLVLILARRHPAFGSSVVLLLMLGAGVVWAANFVVDGQVGDWAGETPIATDANNDSAGTDNSVEIVAVFAATEAGNLFLRIDVLEAQPPTNAAPVLNDTAFNLAENSANASPVGMAAATDADAGQTLTYSITAGNASAAFAIDPATGAITVANGSQLNFEATPSYALTVSVSDNGTPVMSDTATITVNLTDVNEAPTLADATRAVAEDSPVGTPVGAPLGGTDPDAGAVLTYAITGGNTNTAFAIDNAGQITVANAAEVANLGTFNLTVTLTDNGALSDTAAVTVNVTDQNDAPTFTADPYAFSLPENSANATVVGSTPATDSDVGQTLAFAITAGNTGGAFAIDAAGQITVANAAAVDFEANPTFTLTVTVTDDGAPVMTDTASVTITLTDVNETPVANDDAFAVAESAAIGTSVGTVIATDPDIDPPNPPSANATLTYAITAGNTGNAFTIDTNTGVISTAAAVVLANSPYVLTVTVTDGGAPGLTDTATITITVTDQNDQPTLNDASFPLPENSANGTAVGTVTATDPDVGQTFTYSITGGNAAGGFAIDANTGAITVADSAALDFETTPSFSLTVMATDNGAPPLSDTATVTINLSDVNDAPVASDTGFSVAENSANATSVGTYTATDADAGQTLAYAITGGTGAAFFAINAGTGEITVSDSSGLNFEAGTTLTLVVTATDNGAGNLADPGLVTITLTDVNEAPVANDANFTVLENSANGTPVGTATATDVDAGANGTLGYAITAGNTNGAFAIDPSSGAITVANQAEMDFGNTYSLTVTVTDGGALSDTATIGITVDDVNEAPVPTAAPSATPSVAENTAVGTTVATIAPNDPEVGQTHTYAIISGNTGNVFAIDSAGVITVNGVLNFEGSDDPYSLLVRVTDNGTPVLSGDITVTVTLTDVNDAPVIDSTAPTTATEDAVYTYNATRTDEDGPGQNWSLDAANDCAGASIGAGTGIYTFTPAGPTPPASCVVAVQVCDGGTPDECDTQSTTVTITTINSAPVFTNTIPTSATEDVLYTHTPTISDADGPGQAWTLGGTNTCVGTLNPGTGQFSFTPAGPTPIASCVLSLQVCDGGTPDECATQSDTVTVTAVNDAPTVSTTAPTAATEDVLYTYDADLADPDGTGQAWVVLGTNTCAGASIVPGTGVYTFTPAGPTPPASCTLAIEVCDVGGLCGQETATVTITAVNSAPTINSTPPATATEDTLYTYNATRTDADGPGQAWSLLGTNTCAGASIVPGTGVYTFTPAGPTPPADCVVAIQVCDGGTPDECDDQTTTIAITAVNDPPTIDTTAPTTATEDTLYTYNATATDADGVSQTWSLSPGNTCAGASIVAGTGAYTYTPAGPAPVAGCTVGVQVCDNGTPNQCTTQNTPITVSAVNDGPVNVVPVAASVNEDTNLVFNGGNQISILDGDATTMQVTLTATSGVLTTNGIVGLSFTTGDGTADPVQAFSGTLTNVNNALNGLIYRGNLNFFGAATLTVASNDQGSTGSGGALGDSDVISISVNAVNDPPVADDETFDTLGNTELRIDIGATGTPHVVETTGSGTGVRDGDTDPVEAHAFTVTSIVGCGDLTAPYDCTLPSGSLVSMTADGDFTFRPSPTLATGAHTPDTFEYVITDQPPGGEGTPATDTGQVTIRVFDKIWYVQRGASGNGRSDSPLGTFASIHSVGGGGDGDGPGEVIYVHHDATPLDSFIELEANQVLLGGGAALTTVRSLNGDAPPVLIAAGTDTPVRSTAGDTIRIANAIPAEIRGLALGTGAAASNAIDISTTAVTTGLGTLTIADNTFTGATAEGIDVNANSPTLMTLAITGNAWDAAGTHTGNAIDINNTNATADRLRLNIGNNPGILSNASGIVVNGGAAARTTITGFAGNSVHGNTGGAGVAISNVTFDSDAVTAGIQPVDGDNLPVGASGNPVGGAGFAATASQGNLSFDDLDIFAGSGTGLQLGGMGSGLTFAVAQNVGTIDADNGAAVDISTVALDLRLQQLDSTTAVGGVNLNAVSGQFASQGGAIVKASGVGTAFAISSGSVTSDYQGSLNVTSGAGVSLTTNTGAMTFRGGMTLSTGANAAFNATGGGTVHVCDESPCNAGATGALVNTLATTTATALNVANTAIGSGRLEFRSIASNGGSSNGIVLDTTGSAGGLSVKGTGGAGTGGTIANKTGADGSTTQGSGIYLNSTSSVSLSSMQMNDFDNFAIRGNAVNDFALTNSTLNAVDGSPVNGTTQGEGGIGEGSIRFQNLTGTVTLTDSTITHGIYDNVGIFNDNTATALNFTASNTSFATSTTVGNGNDAIRIEIEDSVNGAPQVQATVVFNNDCDFTTSRGDLIDVIGQRSALAASGLTAANAAIVNVTIDNNDFTNNHGAIVSGGGGYIVHGQGNVNFTVQNNDARDARGRAVNISKAANRGIYNGRLNNNRVGTTGVASSGSTESSGLFVDGAGAGSSTVALTSNTVRQTNEAGVFLVVNNQAAAGNNGTAHLTVTGNLVAEPVAPLSFAGLWADIGTGVAGDATFACLDVGGAGALQNDFSAGDPFNFGDINLSTNSTTATRLPAYGGGAADAAAIAVYLDGRNANAAATNSTVFAGGAGYTGGAACNQPL